MSGFDPTTPVTFTMRGIPSAIWFVIAVAVAVIGSGVLVVWAVVSFTIGGMRDDVKSLRESVQALQVADKASAVSLRDIENRLADRIVGNSAGLSGKLDTTNVKLDAVTVSIEGLSKRLEAIAQFGPGDERRKRR